MGLVEQLTDEQWDFLGKEVWGLEKLEAMSAWLTEVEYGSEPSGTLFRYILNGTVKDLEDLDRVIKKTIMEGKQWVN